MEMEEDNITYKQLHEQYMTNLNGTTIAETYFAVTPNYLTVLFVCILATRHKKETFYRKFYNFCIEFIVIVGTAILSCTVFVNYLPHIVISLSTLCGSAYMYKLKHIHSFSIKYEELLQISIPTKHKCYITNFRALINMLTCVSILAVDFTIFPRRFAKTETFGYSPMDVGVGLFCIANSVVIPSSLSNKRTEVNSSFGYTLMKTLKSCIPLILLGGARFFTTKQVDYQVHVSEYGVHWNFFLTLAVSKVIAFLLTQFFDTGCSLVVSLIVVSIHEIVLWKGLQDWVLGDTPRDNFVTANREGIVSSLGYVALFIAGIGIGNLMQNESNRIKDLIESIKRFILFSIFMWTVTFACKDCLTSSRRLANFGYYIWILTYSVTTLTVYMLFDLSLLIFRFSSNIMDHKPIKSETESNVPVLFRAINYNALAFFLIANIFTGLINISIQTLRVNETYSIIILFFYTFVTCTIIYILYCKEIKLKTW